MKDKFLKELYKNDFKLLDLTKWRMDSDKHKTDDQEELEAEEAEEDEEDEDEEDETGFQRRQMDKARNLTKYMQYVTARD